MCEKKYNEALEQAKKELASCGSMDCDAARLILRLFPQLAESEDERMRKLIMDRVRSATEMTEGLRELLLTYLEKQKENPKTAISIPADCASNAKCEDRWHKTANSLPDTGRDVLAKDALGNYLLASFDGAQWFVSVYDGQDHPVIHTPPILEWCDIPSARVPEIAETGTQEQNPTDEDERIRVRNFMMKQFFKPISPDLADALADAILEASRISLNEKQKEPHYTKRNALFDKCVKNCDPKTVEEVNKRVDDIMNMPELSAFEQALTNFIGYWEDDEERWPSQFVKKHGKHILDMAREELQKEQKPIPLMNGDADLYFDNWFQQKGQVTSRQCFEEGIRYSQRLQKEQKPVEWSEEDKFKLEDAITAVDFAIAVYEEDSDHPTLLVEAFKKARAFLKSLRPQNLIMANSPQLKDWSEEDERMLSRCIKSIELSKQFADTETFKKAKDKEIDFLKSLRPIVNANSEKVNVNWSEEDEKRMDSIINILCCYKANLPTKNQLFNVSYQGEVVDADIIWLKSLRPGWKPSEEQMNLLLNIEGGLRAFQYNDKAKALAELYEQLKKLM